MEDKNKLTKEAEELIEEIYEFKREKAKDLNILDTIIEFCFKYNRDLTDVGNILSEHETFTNILENQLKEDKYIKNTRKEKFDEEEW